MKTRGLVIGVGPDSPGYLARCIRWFAAKDLISNGSVSQHNWRAGTARNAGGIGFSLMYYEATEAFHDFLKYEQSGFAEFRAAELNRCPDRYISIKHADPLLFELIDESNDIQPIRHFYCSFEHKDDTGFLGRLCRQLIAHSIIVVQHDAILKKPTSTKRDGAVDHAMRCYAPAHLGHNVAWFKDFFEKCVQNTSTSQQKISVTIEPPDPNRGIVIHELPPAYRPEKRQLACLWMLCDVRNSRRHERSVADLDSTLGGLVLATKILAECADVAERWRDIDGADREEEGGRSLIRLSMRMLGGWAFIVACVPVKHESDATSLGRILYRRLTLQRILDRSKIKQCESGMASIEPWATSVNTRVCLPKFEHIDRSGYLASYFNHIGELTDEVSVIQYDSFAEALRKSPNLAKASHRLCLAATNPEWTIAARKQRLELWNARHKSWIELNA